MFEITYKLTDEDYLKFNEHHILNSPMGRKILLSQRLIGPAVLLLVTFIFFIAGAKPLLFWTVVAVFSIYAILWAIFAKQSILANVKRTIKNMRKYGKLPYSSSGSLIFDENGIREITDDYEQTTKYSSVEKMYVEDSAIYIYFSAARAYIVPFACLGDAVEKDELVEFLRGKIGS